MSIHFILVLMLVVVSSKTHSYELTFPPLEKPVHKKATFTSTDYSNQPIVDTEKINKKTGKESQNNCRACRVIIYYPYMPYSPWQNNYRARNNNFMSDPLFRMPGYYPR